MGLAKLVAEPHGAEDQPTRGGRADQGEARAGRDGDRGEHRRARVHQRAIVTGMAGRRRRPWRPTCSASASSAAAATHRRDRLLRPQRRQADARRPPPQHDHRRRLRSGAGTGGTPWCGRTTSATSARSSGCSSTTCALDGPGGRGSVDRGSRPLLQRSNRAVPCKCRLQGDGPKDRRRATIRRGGRRRALDPDEGRDAPALHRNLPPAQRHADRRRRAGRVVLPRPAPADRRPTSRGTAHHAGRVHGRRPDRDGGRRGGRG